MVFKISHEYHSIQNKHFFSLDIGKSLKALNLDSKMQKMITKLKRSIIVARKLYLRGKISNFAVFVLNWSFQDKSTLIVVCHFQNALAPLRKGFAYG